MAPQFCIEYIRLYRIIVRNLQTSTVLKCIVQKYVLSSHLIHRYITYASE
jgi:hypothetical protein